MRATPLFLIIHGIAFRFTIGYLYFPTLGFVALDIMIPCSISAPHPHVAVSELGASRYHLFNYPYTVSLPHRRSTTIFFY